VQSLRGAHDLRSALVARIISLARAHDLLTERSCSGAELRELVARALEPFAVAQIDSAAPRCNFRRNTPWRFP
jgi:two-component sensor histidine kinase